MRLYFPLSVSCLLSVSLKSCLAAWAADARIVTSWNATPANTINQKSVSLARTKIMQKWLLAGVRVRRLQSKFRPINRHRQRRTIHDARALETINQPDRRHECDTAIYLDGTARKANFNAQQKGLIFCVHRELYRRRWMSNCHGNNYM
jgi:hypothetical protein